MTASGEPAHPYGAAAPHTAPDPRRIRAGLNDVEKEVITLHRERRAAIAGYAAGELTARQLLVELAEIRASATVLTERVRLVSRLAER